MNLPPNFVDFFSTCLLKADHFPIQGYFPALLNPDNLQSIVAELHHIPVVFVLCQALKDKLKNKHMQNFMLDQEKTHKNALITQLKVLVDIAANNPILTRLQPQPQMPGKTSPFKSSPPKPTASEKYALLSSEQLRARIMWFESVNFIQVLLNSVSRTLESLQNNQWFQATSRLRQQLLARLIIQAVLSPIPDEHQYKQKYLSIEYLLRHIQAYLPQQPQSHLLLANVVYEATYYIGQLSQYEEYKIVKKGGRDKIVKMLTNYYERVLCFGGPSCLAVPKFIAALCQMLKVQREGGQDENQGMVEEQNESEGTEWKSPPWLGKCSMKIVELLRGSMRVVYDLQNYLEIKNKIVKILKAILRGQLTSLSPSTTNSPIYSATFTFLNELVQQSFRTLSSMPKQPLQDSDWIYYQFELAETLCLALTANRSFTLSEKKLLEKCVQHYYPKVIEVLPVEVHHGNQHPFTVIVLTLDKLFKGPRLDSRLSNALVAVFDTVMSKLKSVQHREQFASFQDQNYFCIEFFQPIVKFFRKAWNHPTDKPLLIFTQQINQFICHPSPNASPKGLYFVKFVLQLLKCINRPESDLEFDQQLFDLAFSLIFKTKWQNNKEQYIRLLDISLDLLLEEGNSQLDSCFLNKVIRIISLPQFVSKVVGQLVVLLSTQKRQYYVQHIVAVLCRTHRRFKQVCVQALQLQIADFVEPIKREKSKAQRKEDMMRLYFGDVFSIVNKNDFNLLDTMHTIQTRRKQLELIMTLSSYSIRDVYAFFDKFLGRYEFKGQNDVLRFMIDATGALQADVGTVYKYLLFQLIVLKLKQHSYVLNIFTDEKIGNDSYYSTFTGFLTEYLEAWNQLRYERQMYELQPTIMELFLEKLSLLQHMYTVENAQTIADLYTNFIRIPNLYVNIPALPEKIYNTPQSLIFANSVLVSLSRVNSQRDIVTLFRNIFARRTFSWTIQQKNEGYHEELIIVSEKPNALFAFLDTLQLFRIAVFFDYAKLIESIITDLYTLFVEKFSQASVSGFDSEEEQTVNYVEEFIRNKEQTKHVDKLCIILYNFEAITGQTVQDFSQFNRKFSIATKELISRLHIGKQK